MMPEQTVYSTATIHHFIHDIQRFQNSAWSREEESNEKEWNGMKTDAFHGKTLAIFLPGSALWLPFYLFQPPLPMPSAEVLQVTFSSKPAMDSQDLHVRFRSLAVAAVTRNVFQNTSKWRIEGKECEKSNDSKHESQYVHEWKWIIQDDHKSNCHESPAPLGDGGSVTCGKVGLAKIPKICWKSSEVKLSRNVKKRKRYLAHLETCENTKMWGTLWKEKSLAWIHLWLAHSWLSEQGLLLFPHGLALLAWVSLQSCSNWEAIMNTAWAHISTARIKCHMGHDHLLHHGLNLTAHLPAWFCASRSIPQFWFRAAKYRARCAFEHCNRIKMNNPNNMLN